jgi:gliding motility-associated-like protein
MQTFANNPVLISASGTGTYSWSPAEYVDCATCASTYATVNQTTTFVVTNYNEAGCRSEDTLVVHVGCNKDLVFIPNAFSPNGDGKNERFYVRTKGLTHLNYFKIYSRTGQCVFETNSALDGWDGTYLGMKLPPGVFSYYVEITCSENQVISFAGNITLIR